MSMTQLSISAGVRGVVLAGLMATILSPASASDWPRFRGPNGTGISTDAGVPIEIGETTNLLWKVEIPGAGNSSPIVSKRHIFLQTASDDGNQRLLVCLDLADGKQLWSKPAPGATAHTHPKNTLASCSGAADGTRVYMPFWDGQHLALSAYDFDGKHAWTCDLGPFPGGQHGAGHSPTVVGGKVILANDQDGLAEVVAVDAASGVVAWKTPRNPFRSSFSTPVLLEQPGESPAILVTSTDGVSAYDVAKGTEKWRWAWESNTIQLRTVGSPIVSQGMVFFTGGNGPGDRHAVAINLSQKQPARAVNLAWETRKDFPYVPCMLSRGEHLYFINDAGIAGCYVAKTGAKVWNNRLPGGNVTASPVMVENRIYAFSENGHAFVFAAHPTFELLASAKLDEGVMASPAVADGRLLVRGKHHLYCFGNKETKQAAK
jgi:outer membrane protein assembly factor BamB